MRRLTIALLALVLALAFVAALAEGATPHDFGDFTLVYPDSLLLELAEEKEDDQPFFALYSSDITSNLVGVWTAEYQDMATFDPQAFIDGFSNAAVNSGSATGVKVTDVEHDDGEWVDLGGKQAFLVNVFSKMDFTDAGMDVKMDTATTNVLVSDADIGTWMFVISAVDLDGTAELRGILDTIAWND